jgi:hypothetical protein
MNVERKMSNFGEDQSQPNKLATPSENVRDSKISRTPQTTTTRAEAINHRVARFTSISTLSGCNGSSPPRVKSAVNNRDETAYYIGDFASVIPSLHRRTRNARQFAILAKL